MRRAISSPLIFYSKCFFLVSLKLSADVSSQCSISINSCSPTTIFMFNQVLCSIYALKSLNDWCLLLLAEDTSMQSTFASRINLRNEQFSDKANSTISLENRFSCLQSFFFCLFQCSVFLTPYLTTPYTQQNLLHVRTQTLEKYIHSHVAD